MNRFGFQGQETDDEWLGGAVAFKYRVHDARIGRFLSIDPLTADFPYAFSENMLIHMIELEGLEAVEYDDVKKNPNVAYTSWAKENTNKFHYTQIRNTVLDEKGGYVGMELILDDNKSDCSESWWCGLNQANPELAKKFLTSSGNVNTGRIQEVVQNMNGEFRKTDPKVGDLAFWRDANGGHAEWVVWVGENEQFRVIGSRKGLGPNEMG